MAISEPVTMPTTPGFSMFTIQPFSVVGITRSPFSMAQQVQKHDGQIWSLNVELPMMTRAQAAPWIAFSLKLNGSELRFLAGDPAATSPQGVGTGTPVVNGASQTGNSLITDGWTISQTGILKAGDYFSLGVGTSTRLYVVLNDANSDSGGNATFDIWPSLRSSPANNDPLTVNSAKGIFRMSSNSTPWEINSAHLYKFAFAAEEAL